MRLGIRIVSCVALVAIALTMAVFTAADFGGSGETLYTLGEYNGNVAVFTLDGSEMVELTDIALASLRQADREMIFSGISAASQRELQELLEDLGS